MSGSHIAAELRRQISQRDRELCCYCRTAMMIVGDGFTIDHVIPESLGGSTDLQNLCLACWKCNQIKGNRIIGFDADLERIERLFHPVQQKWNTHFMWNANRSQIDGRTPTGRATIYSLRLNRPALVESRKLWVSAGWHPPQE